jgi:hypothetical protein
MLAVLVKQVGCVCFLLYMMPMHMFVFVNVSIYIKVRVNICVIIVNHYCHSYFVSVEHNSRKLGGSTLLIPFTL